MPPPISLCERMRRLGIEEKDLVEIFARSSGPGGQHVNKVSTAVTLRWRSFSVTVQESRSQSANRRLARVRLCERVEQARAATLLRQQAEAASRRRRNSPRPRALKERLLATKRRRASVKKLRQQPADME